MNLNTYTNIYFLGIGGIGMSAIARYFHSRDVRVSGYDKTPSTVTQALIDEGMQVHFDEDISHIPTGVQLVIYTPAIPADNMLFIHLTASGIPCIKRAVALGLISKHTPTIAIAGTHGKTTISAMITHILVVAGIKVEAILGGISSNYNTNYVTTGNPAWMILEADEYDRSFLQLEPDMAAITAMDADHLDIYGSQKKLRESFMEFTQKIKSTGMLLIKEGLERPSHFTPGLMTYHMSKQSDFYASDYYVKDGQFYANLRGRICLNDVQLGLPGRHNLENAIAAAALASMAGAKEQEIRVGLASFKGVHRRFDICYSDDQTTYIDDYAHHPEEIRACIETARELFPGNKITGVFQPHLFSRTRDLADGFAESLALLDDLYLLDIYPAREKPIKGINAGWLFEKIQLKEKSLTSKEQLPDIFSKRRPEILLTMGAGDIDGMVKPIIQALQQKSLA
jgi:UDP-N-acetylmuramate--alanine ligase